MTPHTIGKTPKPIKSLIKSGVEYEFSTSSISDEEEEMKIDENEKMVDDDSPTNASTLSIKGIIWRELGKDTYEKWEEYLSDIKNVGQLSLAFRMYSKLINDAFKTITDEEQEFERKQAKQQVATADTPQQKTYTKLLPPPKSQDRIIPQSRALKKKRVFALPRLF